MSYSATVQELIDQLGRLPGIGPKSAQRVAFHLLKAPPEDALRLSQAIVEAKERVSFCARCFNLSEGGDECAICRDPRREEGIVCVVEDSQDIVAIERTREFRGRYHVLQGAFSPIDGVGVDQLRVKELMTRVGKEDVEEIIVATNPNLEGEATAALLVKYLKPMGVRVTRIASGLPVGGDLEYADELTLGRALEGRRILDDGNRTTDRLKIDRSAVSCLPGAGGMGDRQIRDDASIVHGMWGRRGWFPILIPYCVYITMFTQR